MTTQLGIPSQRPDTKGELASTRAIRNILANWGGYAYAMAVAFFLSPYVLRSLGDSTYGMWALIGALTGYLGLLDFGVRQGVTRYVARYHATRHSTDVSHLVSSAFGMYLCAGTIAILVSIGMAYSALDAFGVPTSTQPAARIVFAIAGATVATALISGVFGGTLAALQRFDLINFIEIAISTVRTAGFVLVLRNGYGITGLATVQLIGTVATCVVSATLVLRLVPELRLQLGYVRYAHVKLLASFGACAFLLQVFNYLIGYTGAVVIGLHLPLSQVTLFSIASNLVLYSRQLTGGIVQTLTPMASEADARSDMGRVAEVTLAGAKFATAVMLPIAITFILRGETFIGLWMGPAYAGPSGQVLRVLAVSVTFWAGVSAAWSVMFGIGKHRHLVPIYFAEALCNVALSVFLVRRVGIVGVAWGTTIPSLIVCLVVWPWYVQRAIGVSRSQFMLAAWGRPAVAAIPFALCSLIIERFWPALTIVQFVAQVAITLPAAIIPYWYLCLSVEARSRLRETLLGPGATRAAAKCRARPI